MRLSICVVVAMVVSIALVTSGAAFGQDDSSRNILKQGLLGAGVGAISSGASGGKAGQGALIGAGTAVVGSALLDAITEPSSSSTRRRPQYAQQGYYDSTPDDQYYEEYYYDEPPQESSTSKVLKQGLLGAGTGAIAAGASGGDAGKGALIGAGTNVIGSALLDTITQPQQQRSGRVYRRVPRQPMPQQQMQQTVQTQQQVETASDGTRKKIIRKYDENGKVVSEEEIYY